MKLTLIILVSAAVVLGLIAFFVVFYSGGTYAVVVNNQGASTSFSVNGAAPSSTTSTLLVLPAPPSTATSTATSSLITAGASTSFSTNYSIPPVTWTEGNEEMAITGASFDGISQLTLNVEVVMGSSTECVPMNLGLLTDEQGDLAAPETTQFTFPDTGTCDGTAGATYNNQPVIFTVDPANFPLFITTGGLSNLFFEVSTTTFGGVDIAIPSHSG